MERGTSFFGPWYTIYVRMNRWPKSRILDQMFEYIQKKQLVRIRLEVVSMNSTIVKVHLDGTGARKENGPQAIGRSREGWTTKIHPVAADARTAVTSPAVPGQAHDAPEGRKLLRRLGRRQGKPHLLMDRAYEGNGTCQPALDLGFEPVVPPRGIRIDPRSPRHKKDSSKGMSRFQSIFTRGSALK